MKTCIVVVSFFMLLLITSSAHAHKISARDSTKNIAIINAKALVMRLDIINTIDQSKFTKSERRILRKETRHIKGDLKELRGGRYFRTGLLVLLVLVPVSVFQLTE
jgi:hypothetical protein